MSLPVQTPAPHAPVLTPHAGHDPATGARCTNCEADLYGPWCARCGEKQPDHHDWTLAGLFHEAMHAFTHLDGTLWRTVVTLVRHPGMLTSEYFAGRKSRYMRPIALFIVVNLAFFVITPRTGIFNWGHDTFIRNEARAVRMEARRAELGLGRAEFRERFDASLAAKKRSMLLVEIPLFALAVAAVQARRRRPVAQHLVFSIHAYTFFALYLGIFLIGLVFTIAAIALGARAVGLDTLGRALDALQRLIGSELVLDGLMVLGLGGWLALALRRVYGDGRAASLVGAALLLGALLGMIAYQSRAVFELTLRLL